MKKEIVNKYLVRGMIAPAVFFFFLPVFQDISVMAIGLYGLYFLINKRFFEIRKQLNENRLLVLQPIYFLVFAIGLIYTSNMHSGWFDLQVKLPFLVFPLLFIGYNNSESKRTSEDYFIIGSVFGLAYFIWRSYQSYSVDHDVQDFLYMKLAHWHHPSFLGFYYTFSIGILLLGFFNGCRKANLVSILAIVFLYIGILLLASKMVIISTLILCLCLPFYYFGKNFLQWKKILFLLFSLTIALGLLEISLKFNSRFEQMENVLEKNTTSNSIAPSTNENSTGSRITIWETSLELLKEHPILGVGTGDVRDELTKKYEAQGNDLAVKMHYNPHNQFLQTVLSVGILGLIALLALLFLPLRWAIKNNAHVLVLMILILLFNVLTESILERQAGILFLAAFYCTYLQSKFSK